MKEYTHSVLHYNTICNNKIMEAIQASITKSKCATATNYALIMKKGERFQ